MGKKPAQPKPPKSFTFRMDPDLREEAEAAARADSRSLSQWIKLAMRAALEKAPPPPRKPRSRQ